MCPAYRLHDEGDDILTSFSTLFQQVSCTVPRSLLNWKSGEVFQSKNEINFLKTSLFSDLVLLLLNYPKMAQ